MIESHAIPPLPRADIAWAGLAKRLGVMIHDARTALGWSQCELARRSGVSQAAISRAEGDGTTIHLVTYARVAVALLDPLSGYVDFLTADLQALVRFLDTIAPGLLAHSTQRAFCDQKVVTLLDTLNRVPPASRDACLDALVAVARASLHAARA